MNREPRLVYLAEFADGYGCNGEETEALILLDHPLNRTQVRTLFASTRNPDLKLSAQADLTPLPPTPTWGPSWGNVGKFQDALAEHRRLSAEYADLLEQQIESTRLSRYASAGLKTFTPLDWWPGYEGRPASLTVVDQHGCRCAYSSGLPHDPDPATTPAAWFSSNEDFTYLSDQPFPDDHAAKIIADAKTTASAASLSYAAELAERAAFVPLSPDQLRLLDYADFETYETRRKLLTERRWAYSSTPEKVYHRRLYTELIEHGIYPIRLGTTPGTYPTGLSDDDDQE